MLTLTIRTGLPVSAKKEKFLRVRRNCCIACCAGCVPSATADCFILSPSRKLAEGCEGAEDRAGSVALDEARPGK